MIDIRIRHPATHLICGPTSSGKTTLAKSLIKNKDVLFNPVPSHVIWFYSEDAALPQDLIDSGLINDFHRGFESFDHLRSLVMTYSHGQGSLVFFDDGLSYFHDSFSRIFYELSHHHRASCILISQQLFLQNKSYRTLAVNTQNMWLMRNPRDMSLIIHLAKQVSPYRPGYIIESYLKATTTPYSYLYFSFHQETSDVAKVMTRILPEEKKPVITFLRT